MRTLKFALRDAYFLQLSKIAFRSTVSDRNVSAPGGARNRFGAETAKKPKQNKKPGDERRANPSISSGVFLAPSDGCARSSISFYPVFVTNLTSG